ILDFAAAGEVPAAVGFDDWRRQLAIFFVLFEILYLYVDHDIRAHECPFVTQRYIMDITSRITSLGDRPLAFRAGKSERRECKSYRFYDVGGIVSIACS